MRSSKTSRSLVAALCSAWLLAELWRGGYPCAAALALCVATLWRLDWDVPRSDAALFCAAAAIYLSTFRWRGGDDGPTSLIPFALLRHHTLTLDPYIKDWFGDGKAEIFTVLARGRHLSIFPIAGGLLALPLFAPTAWSGIALNDQVLHQLSKLSAAAITAGSVVAFRRALRGRCSREWALMLTGVYALGTWAFSVSSQGLWQHGPTCLGLAVGLWGLAERGRGADALAGFGLAFAAAARPDSVFVLAAALAALAWSARERLPGFLAGAAAPSLLLAAYWVAYTGELLPPEHRFQANHFVGFQGRALVGLALSPTRGLLFYCPAALFGLWGARRGDALARLAALASLLGPWLLLSFYMPWVGGNTFGPRYFASTALVLLWACAALERPLREDARALGAWCGAAAFSVLVHAAGAYLNWPGHQDFPTQKAELWTWSLHPLARLGSADGPLRALPAAARLGAAAAALLAGGAGAAALRRRLQGAFGTSTNSLPGWFWRPAPATARSPSP